MTEPAELVACLRDGLRELGIAPPADHARTLARFVALLERWNQAYNLTGTRDPLEIVRRHVLDSLTARPFLAGYTVLDVGAGAGLPGLPLAVVDAARQFWLLDSGGKKTRFMQHAIAELSIRNATIVQMRVEEYAPADAFDTVICRAFASLGDFVASCERLVAVGGRLVAMKGPRAEEEARALPAGWRVAERVAVAVPGLDAERHIIVLDRA